MPAPLRGPGKLAFAAIALAAAGALAFALLGRFAPGARRAPSEAANRYVNPALCAQCHADIASHFHQTGMGRSFYPVSALSRNEIVTAKPFYHAASENYFAMVERGGSYYQRRWQIAPGGRETNAGELRVDYVLGSGNHGRTFLHLTSRGALEQLPLGWYAEKGGYWGMNPGYDRADFPGATRLVRYDCMFCHNAYPRIPEGHLDPNAESLYLAPLPEGIDCQRCHGPGERHIAAVKAGAPAEKVRQAIVNPARLSPQREMEVCLQCHLETTSQPLPHAVNRVNRGPFSYAPGQPLGDFRLEFDRASGPQDRVEVAGAAYRFLQSQCWRKSGASLRCATCHNPHIVQQGPAAAAHYNGVCAGCHQSAVQQAIAAHTHPADPDCVSCHMPKRRTSDAVHIVMTDHFIRRPQPGAPDPLAPQDPASEVAAAPYRGEVALFYPPKLAATPENDLDIAVAQVRDRSNLAAGAARLAMLIEKHRPSAADYYAELGDAYVSAGDAKNAGRYFQQAIDRAPGSSAMLLRYGNALIALQQWADAESVLRRVTALDPADPAAWALLGQALWQQRKDADARPALEKAIQLNPDLPDPHNYLGGLLVRAGDYAGAEQEFREALRIEPGAAEWQTNLANLLASRGDLAEARRHFELSIRLQPDYAAARLGYARLLANSSQYAEAEKQAKAAVDADPASPEAHELWGDLLEARSDLPGAVRELETAVRLAPDFWRAHYELAEALARAGNRESALAHLRIAAQCPDAQVQSAAMQLLQHLSR